jgi:signal transduction histidine kinase
LMVMIDDKGEVTILTNLVKEEIQISITDNGHGISRENLKKVFDPFFTTKDPGKGTGLGLSITYNIIQEHNGTIEIESQVGVGTKVIMKLPIKI